MASPTGQTQPSPELIFDTLNAHQRTAALKAAIELDVFTAIGEGANTPTALAKRCHAAERGARILCDYLVILGFLNKDARQYSLTPDASMFLDRRSPMCMASAVTFLTLPDMTAAFQNLTTAVRKGATTLPAEGAVSHDNPIWIEFARSMAAMQVPSADAIAKLLNAEAGEKWKVLDVAAGHGIFGVTIAQHNPNAEVFALDWPKVLEVAEENAKKVGVASRHHKIPGSAFEVDLGSGYDVILLTNFLHHFDPVMIELLLRKVRAALAPGGRVVTLDFIPNEDRISPRLPASFGIIMLAMTQDGDAYTFSEYHRMFRDAGFSSCELLPLPPTPHRVILSRK
jgi:2-polyprenyl-3-methyl-5-hydroxy-6-metoxy-1,4-benzoquinol methylase